MPSIATEETFARAVEAHNDGRADEALAGYDAILDLKPRHVGALVHHAALCLQSGDEDRLASGLAQLFALSESDIVSGIEGLPASFVTLALLAHGNERPQLARCVMAAAARRWPDSADIAEMFATIAVEADDLTTAEREFCRAANLAPERAELWSALSVVHVRQENYAAAFEALYSALALRHENDDMVRQGVAIAERLPDQQQTAMHLARLIGHVKCDADLLLYIGSKLNAFAAFADAGRAFRAVLDIEPRNYKALIGAGATALRREDRAAAQAHWTDGIASIPNDLDTLLEAAEELHFLLPNEINELILQRACVLVGEDATCWDRIGQAARRLGLGEMAMQALQKALALDPSLAEARAILLETSLSICVWAESEDLIEATIEQTRQAVATDQPLDIDVWNLFAIGADYTDVAAAARHKSKQIAARAAPLRARSGFDFEVRSKDRLRIGYICPYSWRASHTENLRTVVSRHDRGRYELYGYSVRPWTEDDFDRSFRDLFQAFRYTPLDDLEASARLIYDDDIDVLIDSTGHFATHGMDLAAMRPAPIIVHGCAGHNIIGGAEFYDYSLNDGRYLPERFYPLYVEQPCLLPHTAMPAEMLPVASATSTRASFSLPEDRFLFADFNHPCKFDPKVFAAWMAILHQVPEADLVLGSWMAGTRKNLEREAGRWGVDPHRIRHVPVISRPEHLRRLQLCDLALDTFYHCGGVTTIDCLIAGLPIVTALPDRDLPLVNLSLLTAFGLEELVVEGLEAYVHSATDLARAPERLADIRRRMREAQGREALFQPERWVRNLERGIEIMQATYRAGHEPAAFEILDVEAWPDAG